jgi:hypothetical protein
VFLFVQRRVERECVAPGASQLVESIRRRLREIAEQGPQPGLEQIAPRRRLEARRHDVATAVVPHDRKPGAQRGGTIELAELAQQVHGAQDRPVAVGQLAEPPLEQGLAQRILGGEPRQRGVAAGSHDELGRRGEFLLRQEGAIVDRHHGLMGAVGVEARDLAQPLDAKPGNPRRALGRLVGRQTVGRARSRRGAAKLRLQRRPMSRQRGNSASNGRENAGEHRRHVTPMKPLPDYGRIPTAIATRNLENSARPGAACRWGKNSNVATAAPARARQ